MQLINGLSQTVKDPRSAAWLGKRNDETVQHQTGSVHMGGYQGQNLALLFCSSIS